MKKKNKKQLCPLLFMLMCSGAAAASSACGSTDDSEASTLEVELNALTVDSVETLVDCTVEYILDVEASAEQKEMEVRDLIEAQAPSTLGRFIYYELQEDRDLLGREFTKGMTESLETIPGYEGRFMFDVSCGAVRLANPAPAAAGG